MSSSLFFLCIDNLIDQSYILKNDNDIGQFWCLYTNTNTHNISLCHQPKILLFSMFFSFTMIWLFVKDDDDDETINILVINSKPKKKKKQ